MQYFSYDSGFASILIEDAADAIPFFASKWWSQTQVDLFLQYSRQQLGLVNAHSLDMPCNAQKCPADNKVVNQINGWKHPSRAIYRKKGGEFGAMLSSCFLLYDHETFGTISVTFWTCIQILLC